MRYHASLLLIKCNFRHIIVPEIKKIFTFIFNILFFREDDTNFKSNWVESLEHVSAVQKAKNEARQFKNEIRLAQKAGIMV